MSVNPISGGAVLATPQIENRSDVRRKAEAGPQNPEFQAALASSKTELRVEKSDEFGKFTYTFIDSETGAVLSKWPIDPGVGAAGKYVTTKA